jgi:hypothetical protein
MGQELKLGQKVGERLWDDVKTGLSASSSCLRFLGDA